MYGISVRGRTPKPIYGVGLSKKSGACNPMDICLTNDLLVGIFGLVDALKQTVVDLYPTGRAMAEYIAKMSARGGVSVPLFIRLAWRKEHPKDPFDSTRLQLLQIKDLYLRYGFDWKQDKLFEVHRDVMKEDESAVLP